MTAMTLEEPDVLDTQTVDRAAAGAIGVMAAVTGGATAGFDPVIGGIIGTVILTIGTVVVALIGRTGKASPSVDDDALHVPRDEWEMRVRESERWRAHQEEQSELRQLRDDR